ncbi:hypothetical protein ACQ4PT_041967 [Festuca glaucescens]
MAVEVVMKANLAARVHLVAHVLRRTVLRLPFLLLVMLRWFLLTASLAAQMRRCLEIRMGKCPLLSDVLPLPFVDGEEASLNHRKRKIIHNFQVKRARVCLSGPPFREKCIALLKALSPERSYYGVHAYKCEKCDALFWYLKRSKRASVGKGRLPVFFGCCLRGKVSLPRFKDWSSPLKEFLSFDCGHASTHFHHLIMHYNSLFSFTSMGADVDRTVNSGIAPYIFKMCGYVYHQIGSLLPYDTNPPKFVRLYIVDSADEVQRRLDLFGQEDGTGEGCCTESADPLIVRELTNMLNQHSHLVEKFRFVRRRLQSFESPNVVIRFFGDEGGSHGTRYSRSMACEVAALIVGDLTPEVNRFDVVVETNSHELRHVSSLNPSLMALKYPLLFPYEANMLAYHFFNQNALRSETYQGITDGIGEDLYVVEFQKRGLRHTHTLIWFKRNTKEPSSGLIDSFISAKLPDPEKDPLRYVLVDKFMVHGPCVDLNTNFPCMKGGVCSKRFPKAYNDEALVDVKGFLVYRRRDDGRFVLRNRGAVKLTNKWVVLHNLVLRSERRIVLDVASSRVASLLLPNGRTAHSRFRIPLDVNDKTQCNILRGSTMAALLEETSLILWDEAPMTIRYCFEALDRTLRDVISPNDSARSSLPFGGKTVILGGDFRQVLPVIEGGSRNEIIDASLIASPLWQHVTLLSLKENMHLKRPDLSSADREEFSTFVQWVLDVGNSDIPGYANDGEDSGSWITIPDDLVLHPASCNADVAIQSVYDSLFFNYASADYLAQRAIMCPTNTVVDEINDSVFERVSGCSRRYLSCDSISKSTDHVSDADLLYPPEFCHSVTINNVPQHELNLKVGVPVMLLKNTNQSLGLCNGLLAFKSTSIIRWHVNVPILEIDVVRERSKHLPWHIKLHSGNQSCSEPTVSSIAEIATFEPNYIMKSIMEGLVPGNSVDPDQLKEGSAYTIDRFDIYDPKKSYRSVDHPLRICFTMRTVLAEVVPPPENFPMFSYNAIPFSMLSDRIDQNILLSGLLAFKSTSVTRWDVNVPIPEIAIFRERSKHLPWRIELHS